MQWLMLLLPANIALWLPKRAYVARFLFSSRYHENGSGIPLFIQASYSIMKSNLSMANIAIIHKTEKIIPFLFFKIMLASKFSDSGNNKIKILNPMWFPLDAIKNKKNKIIIGSVMNFMVLWSHYLWFDFKTITKNWILTSFICPKIDLFRALFPLRVGRWTIIKAGLRAGNSHHGL